MPCQNKGYAAWFFSLLNQNATGTETNIQVHIQAKLHLENTSAAAAGGDRCQYCVYFLQEGVVLCPKLAIVEQGDIANG